jgi:[protein-PII] uridylyltransferase
MGNRRAIIDRKALTGQLDELAGWSGYSLKTRGNVLDILSGALRDGEEELRRRFEEQAVPGIEVVRDRTYLVDQTVRLIHDFALRHVYPLANPTAGEQVSVVATGGYGRGEMAPYSDVDLMFLLPYKQTPHTEQVVEFILYLLWDLRLKVGNATRSVDDCLRLAREDLTIRTSLLEARWLWADEELYRVFRHRFWNELVAETGTAFVEAKLAERDLRHERMGDTRYVLEPNVKEGKGGLRDLQTLFWIAKYLYRVDNVSQLVERKVLTSVDAVGFAKAENFLWTVRSNLHHLAGRAEERLAFNVQTAISERMGYTDRAGVSGVERFMKHYFLVAKDVGDLTRILCAVLEEQNRAGRKRFRMPSLSFRRQTVEGFRVEGNRLSVASSDAFSKDPIKLLRLFREAQRHELDVHPQALRLVTQNLNLIDNRMREDPAANAVFMEMLLSKKDPEEALKRLNEAGVFGRFVPEFGRIVAQMQYDMYHVYTVDEHTIRAIGIVHRIKKGELTEDHPLATAVIGDVRSRKTLYVAVLLHDIAKGRAGDHCELGAEIAEKLGPRLGLSDWETETAAWLVRNHLRMSHTAFKRDVEDFKTISDFVSTVQSPERLRLLLILTVADIRAVGPNVWNPWKATLLRELYHRAQDVMTGGLPGDRRAARVERAQAALRERLTSWSEADVETHLARGYDDYWLNFDTDTHELHAGFIARAERQGLTLHIETRVDQPRNVTELIIYTADHPGLFARIAGAIALGGASIVDAKIVTLSTGMALDTFSVQDFQGSVVEEEARLRRLWDRIEAALTGNLDPAAELERVRSTALPSRTDVFQVPPHVVIDNTASNRHTVIEINGRDRPGFLYDVTRALTAIGLQIASARITTYGERVVDVFYVKNVFGLKVEHDQKLREIHDRLLAAIVSPE